TTRPLDEVVVDDIAAAAGISRGLLFHYFTSKHAFFAAVAEAVAAEFLAATDPDPSLSIDEQLHQSLDRYVRYIEEHQIAYLSLIRGSAGGHLAAVFERTRERIVDRILDGLGLPDPPAKLRLATRGWVALCEEISLEWLPSRAVPRHEIVALLEQSLVRVLELAG
ncbi:MAG: TetR/AcrR family transcriptional regulator, partial [Acidimicrobiales bacterium]